MSNTYCSSCKIEVQNGDTLRDHYKGEFHRYNIKRKIVGLPPVTTDQFAQKKSQLLAESSQSERDQLIKCELCSKTFASKGTYKQHLESNKHKENLKKFNRNERSPVKGENKEQEDKSGTTAQDQTVCLFCNKKSADVDENLVHMRLSHSFFISDLRNLKDLKGLLRYLGNKVHRRGLCIYCGIGNSRETRSGEAVQRHMIDKGHIFMNTEDFGEYERFYDFSKAMEEFRRNNLTVEKDDVIMEEDEYMEIEIGNDEEERSSEEDDWEVIEKEGEKVYRLRTAKVLDSGEIQLPNGNILGHRKYKNAYKQYYRDLVRQSSLETSAIDYQDKKSLAARQEENRLAQVNQDLMRRERTAVESLTHKMVHRKEREALKQGLRANNALHFRKQQN